MGTRTLIVTLAETMPVLEAVGVCRWICAVPVSSRGRGSSIRVWRRHTPLRNS